ncbi:MAG: hypothetical protein JWN15_3342 [Firmicutes bacterium]|nr:hypothetical protein [Bacillota bacterium]
MRPLLFCAADLRGSSDGGARTARSLRPYYVGGLSGTRWRPYRRRHDLGARGGTLSANAWTGIATVVSLLAFATAAAAHVRQRRAEDFRLARDLHVDLTTGEVAKAREVLGTLVHDGSRIKDEDIPRVRTSYFTLLWCFERIYAGRCAIADGWTFGNRPLRFLDRLVVWQVEYWAENLGPAKEALEARLGVQLSDGKSRLALDALNQAIPREIRAETSL